MPKYGKKSQETVKSAVKRQKEGTLKNLRLTQSTHFLIPRVG